MPTTELTKFSLAAPGASLDIELASPLKTDDGLVTSLRIETDGDTISVSSFLGDGSTPGTYSADMKSIADSLSDDVIRTKFLEQWARWAETPGQSSSDSIVHDGQTEVYCPGGVLVYLCTETVGGVEKIFVDVFACIEDVDIADDEGVVAHMSVDSLG